MASHCLDCSVYGNRYRFDHFFRRNPTFDCCWNELTVQANLVVEGQSAHFYAQALLFSDMEFGQRSPHQGMRGSHLEQAVLIRTPGAWLQIHWRVYLPGACPGCMSE